MPIIMSQGVPGNAVPYYRSGTMAGLTLASVSPIDSARLRRYEEGWRFFQGLHWNFTRENGEPLVVANYTKAIINKKASWLAGSGMQLSVPEALDHLTKPDLDEVWSYNGMQTKLLEIAITGGTTGDVFLVPMYEAPSTEELAMNPFTGGKVRIRIVQPHNAFPIWDPLNKEKMLAFRIMTEVDEGEYTQPRSSLGFIMPVSRKWNSRRKFVEEITPTEVRRGWEGDGAPTTEPNILNEIPVVHIRNEIFPGEPYGISDADGIIDLQRGFNEMLTDVADMVHYHANPVTIITGAIARTLERGPKALWSIKESNAKVFNLQPVADLGAAKLSADNIRMMMFDISGVPEGSLGRQQQISNTSAQALSIQFGPLIEATKRKAPNYERGLEKLNYLILRYVQIMRDRMYPIDVCANCGGRVAEEYVETPGGPVPRRRCFHVDKQTMDFLEPDDFVVNWRRDFSFGSDVVQMRYGDVKKIMAGDKPKPSYWDPKPEAKEEQEAVDEENEVALHEHQTKTVENQTKALAAAAPPAPPTKKEGPPRPGEKKPSSPPPAALGGGKPVLPPAGPAPLPAKPAIQVPQLNESEVDLPPEPQSGKGFYARVWEKESRTFTLKEIGERQVVPTGCERPHPVSPYTNKVELITALPRDLADETNLLSSWMNGGIISVAEARRRLPIDTVPRQLDKEILDDIAVSAKRAAAAEAGKLPKADNGGKAGAAAAATGVKGTNSTPTQEKQAPREGAKG